MNKVCFGVDVGGTTIKMGLFDMEGTILDKWEINTRIQDNGVYILPDVAEAVKDKLKEKSILKDDVIGVGIGTPGPVDSAGVVYGAVNLGWGIFNVRKTLQQLLDIPVKAGNDANVAALGEMWKGGGKGHKNVVAVTLGTGVGGGIIIDGKMLTGAGGAGGEIGHIHVEDKEEIPCNCGNKGCLEQYSSATGIVRLAKKHLDQSTNQSVLRDVDLSAKAVFDAVKSGDELAIEVANEFGEYLGKALAAIAGVINPEIFVIGGGVSKAGDILLEYIQKYYIPVVFKSNRNVLFSLATLENDAGIFGAAKLVLE